MTPHESLYDHAGGDPAIHALEKAFYAKVLADLVLQPLFGAGQPQHLEHLTWFTAESFGGPHRFTRELGFRHLIDVHRHLHITGCSASGSSSSMFRPWRSQTSLTTRHYGDR